MSYESISICVKDELLISRVVAAASKEAWAGGPEFSGSEYGERLRTYPQEAETTFMYAIAIDNEADYQYALDTNHESPGSADVINDAKIQAGVQAHWPTDPYAVPLPTEMVGPTPGVPVTP